MTLKKYIATTFLLNSLLLGVAGATALDIKTDEPTIVSTNPMYFLKEWGRNIKLFFSFKPLSKALLELQIVEQKALEILKVQELRPDDSEALAGAIENYQESQTDFKFRLDNFSDNYSALVADKLINEVVVTFLKQAKIFETLLSKENVGKNEIRLITKSIDNMLIIASNSYQLAPDTFLRTFNNIFAEADAVDKDIYYRWLATVLEKAQADNLKDILRDKSFN